MKSGFWVFFKKECTELWRGGKLMILLAVFVLFGIMNPAIAKLTPWLMEHMADELAGSGLSVSAVTVDASTSFTQFFKNIPITVLRRYLELITIMLQIAKIFLQSAIFYIQEFLL